MVFGQEISARMRGTSSASTAGAGRPAERSVAPRYSPLAVVTRRTSPGARPHFLAKPWSAGVGEPSAA